MLLEEAESIVKRLEEARLVRSVWLDTSRAAKRLELDLDPIDLALHGAEPALVLQSLRTAIRGRIAAQFPEAGGTVPVRVRLDPQQTATETGLAQVHVPAREDLVEIGTLGSIERGASYHRLYRVDRIPAVSLTLVPTPGSKRALVEFLSSRVDARGEVLSISALQRNQGHILLVFGLALVLMYLMIGAQFESFLLPLLLLLTLVPACAGSLITLLLWGYSLNINSFLGILILTGTAINISIILTVALQSTGSLDRDALIRVCTRRLTPIAATTLSTMAAMIPIASMSGGEGALQSHTAVALLGGLFFALVSILLIFPVLADRFFALNRLDW
jgi:multidrug efflux pump subunit AcrB